VDLASKSSTPVAADVSRRQTCDIQNAPTEVGGYTGLDRANLEALSRAVLHEGHSLFPYTRSAVKNAKSIPFGVVYPQEYAQHHLEVSAVMQTECLVTGGPDLRVEVTIRFLQRPGSAGGETIERKTVSDTVPLGALTVKGVTLPIQFEHLRGTVTLAAREVEDVHILSVPPRDGSAAFRLQQPGISPGSPQAPAPASSFTLLQPKGCAPVQASGADVAGQQYQGAPVQGSPPVSRLTARIINITPIAGAATASREEMFPYCFLSAHTILTVTGGKFLSVLEPAPEWRSAAEQCQNFGTWPVLVGEDDRIVLSSPIILYDHPQLANESTGDLFDATEIEEALLLHLSALPEAEKDQIAGTDEKLRQMLARAGSVTPEQMWKLHGTCHELLKPKDPL
jgi:hypothetical protein